MELTDKEVYQWLLVSNRYAKTRNNHLEPAYTFDKTIEVLNKWENETFRNQTATQILDELAFDAPFISESIDKHSTHSQMVGIENHLRKTYIEYANNLSKLIDPKKLNKEIQSNLQKINKCFGHQEQIR